VNLSQYQDVKRQIETKEEEIKLLKAILKNKCPHNNIVYDSYCNDTYAYYKSYTKSYKCSCCGLYASDSESNSLEQQKIYEKLQKKYDEKQKKVKQKINCYPN
jgi:hypothetical protein